MTTQLRPVAGAYEIVFGMQAGIHRPVDVERWLTIFGGRTTALVAGGKKLDLGFAYCERPIHIRQDEAQVAPRVQGTFVLPLQPHQLSTLNGERAGGDLRFELVLAATSGDNRRGDYNQSDYLKVGVLCSKSEWVTLLNAANALNVFLIEVSMPLHEPQGSRRAVGRYLQEARVHFENAEYRDCVAKCRQTLEQLEPMGYGTAAKIIAGDKDAIPKEQREHIVLTMLHHYTQLSAHSEKRGGHLDYTQADARLILSVAAAFASYRPT